MSEEYLNFISKRKADAKPMTRTQSEFVEFLLENKKIIAVQADLATIFREVQNYLLKG
jgi:hypothetical protein